MSSETQSNEKLTRRQQKALHVWFRQVAEELNKEGIGMALLMQQFVLDVPATPYLIKEMWRTLQEGMLGKHSTTDLLKREEIDKIHDALNKFLAETFQVATPPFPSLEEINLKQTYGTQK